LIVFLLVHLQNWATPQTTFLAHPVLYVDIMTLSIIAARVLVASQKHQVIISKNTSLKTKTNDRGQQHWYLPKRRPVCM